MSHEVEVYGNAVVATVHGALDGEAARGLSSGLRSRSSPGATVIIDMSGVSSVDVEGITQVVALKRWAERESGKLILAAPSYEVMDALRSNGLDRIFETSPSREDALDIAGAGGGAGSSAAAYSTGGYGAPPMPPPEIIPTDPEPFHPTTPPPMYAPEEATRRAQPGDPEENAWVKPDRAATRQAPPPETYAPPPLQHQPPRKKKSALPLILFLLILLGGGGFAAWYFLLNKKPEVVAQTGGAWPLVEGTEADFEIKFRNAISISIVDELPDDLTLNPDVKTYADGTKSQTIVGDTRKLGEHAFSVQATPEGGGTPSPAVKFSFNVTPEEVRNTAGTSIAEGFENQAFKPKFRELARGCKTVSAKGLEDTGLTVTLDGRTAYLEGTPVKAGTISFTLNAENADAKAASFPYTVVIKPDKAKVVSVPVKDPTPPLEKDPTSPEKEPTTTPEKDPTTPEKEPVTPEKEPTQPVKKPDLPVKEKPPVIVEEPEEESIDPAMLAMLRDRIDKSRYSDSDKARMRSAVNQVQFARRIASVKFGNAEKSLSSDAKDDLRKELRAAPELAKGRKETLDFVVIGYASRKGALPLNIAISKARAASVEAVLKGSEFGVTPKFTGDYGATDVLGSSEEANRVVEVYAVLVKKETADTLRRLIEDMKRLSGSH